MMLLFGGSERQAFWLYPVYAISLILNMLWYQEVADHAYIVHGLTPTKKPFSWKKMWRSMSDQVYLLLLMFIFNVQRTVMVYLPFCGNMLAQLHMCWLIAFNAFNYFWALKGYDTNRQFEIFETHWAYFTGFGAPATVLAWMFPYWISVGMGAAAFPLVHGLSL
jgi:etoposide-induced 2.4 mRNA